MGDPSPVASLTTVFPLSSLFSKVWSVPGAEEAEGADIVPAEPAAPPRLFYVKFKVINKLPNASAFANSSSMKVTGNDFSTPCEMGVVYGYMGDLTRFVPEALGGYTRVPISDAEVRDAAALLKSGLATTRIMAERSEKDVQASILHILNDNVFQSKLGNLVDTGSIPQSRALRGPYVTAAPDWRACWKEAPMVEFKSDKSTYQKRVYALAVAEVKGTYSSVHGAFVQAALTACCAADVLFSWNLPLDRCIVPFFANNGLEEKHGVVHLLSNRLPCVATLAPLCSLLSPEGLREAAQWRLRMCAFVGQQAAWLQARKASDGAWYAGLKLVTEQALRIQKRTSFLMTSSSARSRPGCIATQKRRRLRCRPASLRRCGQRHPAWPCCR